MTAGWGTSGWGTGTWGSSSITTIGAVAVSTHTVRVTFSAAPPASSTTALGDALNPDTWSVERLDTGFVFTVGQVARVEATIFDVSVLEPFGSFLVTHLVVAEPIAPSPATFLGILSDELSTPAALAVARKFSPTDVSNPQTPQGTMSLGGTLVITPGGDYDTVTGAALVKKLITRRIFTKKGAFFHLPDYGLGFAIKEPIPSSDLIKLKAEIERQARLEPEVEDVNAGLLLSNDSLIVRVQAKLRPTGESLNFDVNVVQSGVAL